jgi:hypothetical protein
MTSQRLDADLLVATFRPDLFITGSMKARYELSTLLSYKTTVDAVNLPSTAP